MSKAEVGPGGDNQPDESYVDQDEYFEEVGRRRAEALGKSVVSRQSERESIAADILNRHFGGERPLEGEVLPPEEVRYGLGALSDPEYAEAQRRMTGVLRELLDNAALQAHPHPGLLGVSFLSGLQSAPLDELYDVKERRVSRVYKIWSWPRNARDRGWGLIHDQIWFYDDAPSELRAYRELTDVEVGEGREIHPLEWSGKWWRRDHDGKWLRLYMDRKMLWGPRWMRSWRIRLHHFFSGDDDSAPHDHPWAFVTFPLSDYTETVELDDDAERSVIPSEVQGSAYVQCSDKSYALRIVRKVRRWRFHFRPALHRHYVHEPRRPFRTIVFACAYPERVWGFWPEPDVFVKYTDWTEYTR